MKLEKMSGPVTTPNGAGLALELAGDVLRRTKALHSMQQVATQTLEKVDGKAAAAFVQSIDVAAEKARLQQALNDAFECMLADPDERLMWRDRALANLAYRDRLTSIQAALVMTGNSNEAVNALTEKLAQVDAGLSKKARMLVGLNEARRAELEALNAGERAAAWWFGARSRCDALASVYAGTDARDAHLESCEDCKRDALAAKGSHKPAHLDADSLRRREDGTATTSENAWMDAHAKSCHSCRRAIEALGVSVDA